MLLLSEKVQRCLTRSFLFVSSIFSVPSTGVKTTFMLRTLAVKQETINIKAYSLCPCMRHVLCLVKCMAFKVKCISRYSEMCIASKPRGWRVSRILSLQLCVFTQSPKGSMYPYSDSEDEYGYYNQQMSFMDRREQGVCCTGCGEWYSSSEDHEVPCDMCNDMTCTHDAVYDGTRCACNACAYILLDDDTLR